MEGNKGTVILGNTFCELLAIVFIVLKLLGKITWSWVWVLSPIWIPFVIAITAILLIIIPLKIAKIL